MTEEVLRKVLESRRADRQREEAAAEARRAEAFAVPEIADAQRAYVIALHKSLMRPGEARKAAAESARETYLDALAKYGWSEKDFSPRVKCEKCGDLGMCGEKLCDCVRDELIKALGVACDISPEGYSLSDFDEKSVGGAQSAQLKKAYSWMSTYVSAYPDVKYRYILLSGGTGTGKTVLATAAAREMIRHGHSAVVMSANAFNSLMLKCHTSPYSERDGITSDVMSAEMLVIDDLGTEPVYNNVTFEYLLLVLSERFSHRLPTVITTNLDADDFAKRYNERICSRLFDRRVSKVIEFSGDDLRRSAAAHPVG